MKIIDAIENFINSFKEKPTRLHVEINDPVGTVVAKVFFCEDLNRSMYETDDFLDYAHIVIILLRKSPIWNSGHEQEKILFALMMAFIS